MRIALAFAAAFTALAAVLLYCFPPQRTHPIDPSRASHREGHAYVLEIAGAVPLGRVIGIEADSNERPHASELRLLEDGKPLGPAHAVHSEIASKGEGRYSHWGGGLIFSASDNSDPRTNGRRYSVGYAAAPAWWMALLLVVLAAAAVRRRFAVPAAPAIAYWTGFAALVLYVNWVFQGLVAAPLAHPDSRTYLFWSLYRSWGYPALLHAYHWVFGTWEWLPLFQLNLVLAGLAVLAHAVARLCGYLAAWVVTCAVFGAGMLLASSAEILTEAAFGAFVMAHAGFMIHLLHGGRRVHGLLAGLCLAAAVAIKSVGVVLLGPLVLFMALLAPLRSRIALLVLLPGAVAWFAPAAYNFLRYGELETSHIGGLALGGHVAWAMHPQPGSPVAAEARLVEAAIEPAIAKRPPSFPSVLDYVDYTAREYNELLWARMVPALTRYYAERRPPESCTWDGLDRGGCNTTHPISINRTLLRLSREAIAAQPGAYLYHVAAHDYGMWRDVFAQATDLLLIADGHAASLPSLYDPARNKHRELLSPLPELKSPTERAAFVSAAQASPVKRFLDLVSARTGVEQLLAALGRWPWILFAIAFLASIPVLVLARLGTLAQASCYLALCLNAYMLGTALAQPSLVRYAMAVQGLAAALLVLVATGIARKAADGIMVDSPRGKEHR